MWSFYLQFNRELEFLWQLPYYLQPFYVLQFLNLMKETLQKLALVSHRVAISLAPWFWLRSRHRRTTSFTMSMVFNDGHDVVVLTAYHLRRGRKDPVVQVRTTKDRRGWRRWRFIFQLNCFGLDGHPLLRQPVTTSRSSVLKLPTGIGNNWSTGWRHIVVWWRHHALRAFKCGRSRWGWRRRVLLLILHVCSNTVSKMWRIHQLAVLWRHHLAVLLWRHQLTVLWRYEGEIVRWLIGGDINAIVQSIRRKTLLTSTSSTLLFLDAAGHALNDVLIRDISIQDISIRDISIRDFTIYDVSICDITICTISVHDISFNDVSVDDISFDDVTVDNVSVDDAVTALLFLSFTSSWSKIYYIWKIFFKIISNLLFRKWNKGIFMSFCNSRHKKCMVSFYTWRRPIDDNSIRRDAVGANCRTITHVNQNGFVS